jgi:hypothetical protein
VVLKPRLIFFVEKALRAKPVERQQVLRAGLQGCLDTHDRPFVIGF